MYKHLNQQQRYTISVMKQKGLDNNFIADAIGVDRSTVYRELKRNSGKRGYSHTLAQEMADERKERLVNNSRKKPEVWKRVHQMLREDLSPEQISGVLRKEGIKISHECIYQHIRKDKADRDECRRMQEHPEPHKHLGTTAGGGGQKQVRALGDGHNSRQGQQGGDIDADGTNNQPVVHGASATWQKRA